MDTLIDFKYFLVVLTFSVVEVANIGLPLPDFVEPCAKDNPNFNQCVKEHAVPVIKRLKYGLPEYKVPPMDPLYVREIFVDSTNIGISMQSFDVLIHGLSLSKPLDPWITNITSPSFRWRLFAPRIEILSRYETNGRVLFLPITGKGNSNITMLNVDYVYSFDCDLKRKEDGKDYLVPKSSHIDFKSSRTYTSLTNLFNGNKFLGDEMNYFLNQHWKEIQKEFGPPIADALAKAIREIVDGITSQVPFDVVFPDSL